MFKEVQAHKYESLDDYCMNDEDFRNEMQIVKLNNQNIAPIMFILAVEDDIKKGAALAMEVSILGDLNDKITMFMMAN